MATAGQLNQAIGLIQGNQHADAEALLTPLLNQSATDVEVLQLLALACKRQLDLAGAEIAFKQSIDLHAAPAVFTNLAIFTDRWVARRTPWRAATAPSRLRPRTCPRESTKGVHYLQPRGLKRPSPFTSRSLRRSPNTPMPALVSHSPCSAAARVARPLCISRKFWPRSPTTPRHSMDLA